MDLHLAISGHRMNEAMKVLSVVGIIFIPLTFIAGIYGMNFEHMPELHYRWGYPIVLLAMLLSAVAMGLWARLRSWI